MVYGPTFINTGFNICIVRNSRLVIDWFFKNKITLVHKDTLEEAEVVMRELKELFSINDMYDIRRIKYEKSKKHNL